MMFKQINNFGNWKYDKWYKSMKIVSVQKQQQGRTKIEASAATNADTRLT